MNARAPSPAAEAVPASLTATFKVVQRTMNTFAVVRTLSGPGVLPYERVWRSEPHPSLDAANAFAASAALRFGQENPGAVAVAEPFPTLGRRPGQSYAPCYAARNNHVRFHEDLGIEAKFVGRPR